jgi:hypothetical protein
VETNGTPTGLADGIEALFRREVAALVADPRFTALERGTAGRQAYDTLVASIVRAHACSPQLVAFLYALAPPAAAHALAHNVLEELGRDEDDGVPHPAMLRRLAAAAGLGARLAELEARAAEDLREAVVAPMLYGSLRELGFAAMVEIVAFEYMLSRVARRLARALGAHRGLPAPALAWFDHHSEVDVRHAEEGLRGLAAFARYYDLPDEDALALAEATLRENVFLRRYFPGAPAAEAPGPVDAGARRS